MDAGRSEQPTSSGDPSSADKTAVAAALGSRPKIGFYTRTDAHRPGSSMITEDPRFRRIILRIGLLVYRIS